MRFLKNSVVIVPFELMGGRGRTRMGSDSGLNGSGNRGSQSEPVKNNGRDTFDGI